MVKELSSGVEPLPLRLLEAARGEEASREVASTLGLDLEGRALTESEARDALAVLGTLHARHTVSCTPNLHLHPKS